MNSFEIQKDRSPDYVYNNCFFCNLLITFSNYYYAIYMFLTSLIWLIFSDFYYIARYWNSERIKLLVGGTVKHSIYARGGGLNFERRNVERLTFRNFKIANIKITKDELFVGFIVEFIFSFFRNYLNTRNI